MESVLPPCTRAPWRKSAHAAPKMRITIEARDARKSACLRRIARHHAAPWEYRRSSWRGASRANCRKGWSAAPVRSRPNPTAAPVSMERIFWIVVAGEIDDQRGSCPESRIRSRDEFRFHCRAECSGREFRSHRVHCNRRAANDWPGPDGESFSRGDAHRGGINPSGGLLDMAGQALINHPAIGNPVVESTC